MVVEQKVASMAPLQIKSYLLGPILNNFQKGLGWTNLQFHFLILHHEFGNSFYSKFWHINQKKFMKQKRQLIDHWVASRGPFLRFLFHFRDKSFFMTTGATLGRFCLPPLNETIRTTMFSFFAHFFLSIIISWLPTLFRVFDDDHSGKLDFHEYILALNATK